METNVREGESLDAALDRTYTIVERKLMDKATEIQRDLEAIKKD